MLTLESSIAAALVIGLCGLALVAPRCHAERTTGTVACHTDQDRVICEAVRSGLCVL